MIACEDSGTAAPACEVLELVERNLKNEGRLNYLWWNFEVLAIPALRELAAAEAAAADMIIIGIHESRELPPVVTDWMHQWLPLRKDRPGALVAVLDSDLNKPVASQGLLTQLEQVAALGQMSFFATRAREMERDAGVTRKFSEVVRQFVLAHKNGARNVLPGDGTMPTEVCGTSSNQIKQARL